MLTALIKMMNGYVERIDAIPFSLWDGLQISLAQSVLMIIMIAGFSYWLFHKSKPAFVFGFSGLLLFFILHGISYYEARKQEKLIVYNVPGLPAIDFIKGQHTFFTGDEAILKDEFILNFHLKPSRIYNRINHAEYDISRQHSARFFEYGKYKIAMIPTSIKNMDTTSRQPVDLVIISGKSLSPDANAVFY